MATILFLRGLLQIVAAFGIVSRKDWGRKLGIAFGILDLLEGGVALLYLIACIRNATPSPADIPLVGFMLAAPICLFTLGISSLRLFLGSSWRRAVSPTE